MRDLDLCRIADDLDHIRALGRLAPGRLESLRLAAAELRARAALRDAGPLIGQLGRLAAEVGPLVEALRQEPRP